MADSTSRREFFINAAKQAVGISAGAVGLNLLITDNSKAQSQVPPWPWPYAKLDPEYVRVLAHDAFWVKGCSYAAFKAIIQGLAEKVGEPFTLIPPEILAYGYGGTVGWGTLCGTLNGAAAAISLVQDKATTDALVNELIGWYTQTAFPSDNSNALAASHAFTDNRYDGTLQQSISGSPLCHVSLTEWCSTAGFEVEDVERKERCARLAGDVAAKATELLNQQYDSQFTALYVTPQTVSGCMTCHGSGYPQNVAAKVECSQCHGDPHKPTLHGDLDGDGDVDFPDFLAFAKEFGKKLSGN